MDIKKILAAAAVIGCSIPSYSLTTDRAVPADTVTICIIGDVMLHSAQIENCFSRYAATDHKADPAESGHYDFSPCFSEIRTLLEDADICAANMEFTLAGPPYSGYPAFCAPDSYAGYAAYFPDCQQPYPRQRSIRGTAHPGSLQRNEGTRDTGYRLFRRQRIDAGKVSADSGEERFKNSLRQLHVRNKCHCRQRISCRMYDGQGKDSLGDGEGEK